MFIVTLRHGPVKRARKKAAIKRVLLASDGSKHSDMFTCFLLSLPLPWNCDIIGVTALQSHLAAWIKMPTLDFQTNQELLARLQAAEESEARKITAKSEKQFQAKGHKTASIVLPGGAAESILARQRNMNQLILCLEAMA